MISYIKWSFFRVVLGVWAVEGEDVVWACWNCPRCFFLCFLAKLCQTSLFSFIFLCHWGKKVVQKSRNKKKISSFLNRRDRRHFKVKKMFLIYNSKSMQFEVFEHSQQICDKIACFERKSFTLKISAQKVSFRTAKKSIWIFVFLLRDFFLKFIQWLLYIML